MDKASLAETSIETELRKAREQEGHVAITVHGKSTSVSSLIPSGAVDSEGIVGEAIEDKLAAMIHNNFLDIQGIIATTIKRIR